jgi:DNA repair photolyase
MIDTMEEFNNNIKEINVDSLIKKITKVDDLFKGNYTIDPYQNCSFGCIYCDSTLDNTIYIKLNAITILKKELHTLPPGRIIIGSVHDPYQPVEQKYHLTHEILNALSHTEHSVHILTKSTEVLNDLPLLQKLHDPIVTFTILSLDEKVWKTIEPFAPSPKDRLDAMHHLSNHEITTGVAIIPTLPFFSEKHVDQLIKNAKKHKAHYILHKPLFLQGEQKRSFLKKFQKNYPSHYVKYKKIYDEQQNPPENLLKQMNTLISDLCSTYNLPMSITE